MRKGIILLALTILLAQAVSEVNLNKAYETAAGFQKNQAIESLDSKPQNQKAYYKSTSYWVIEIVSQGEIVTLVPIDAETGEVELDESKAKEVMKVHWTAHYFATDSSLTDYLENEKDKALGIQGDISAKEDQLDLINLPEGVTLSSLSEFENALSKAKADAKSVQLAAVNAKLYISPDSIQRAEDIQNAKSAISNYFSKQKTLHSSLRNLISKADKLRSEASEKSEELGDTASVLVGLTHFTTFSEVQVSAWETDLIESQSAINKFFDGIDSKIDVYYSELLDRLPNDECKEIMVKYNEYTTQRNQIIENCTFCSTLTELDELDNLLTQLKNDYNSCNLTSARKKYTRIEELISKINDTVNNPPECTPGETRACGKNGIQKCVNGKWGDCVETTPGPSGISINWPLVGSILLLVFALLVYKFRDKLLGGGEGEKEASSPYYDMYGK